MPPARLAVLLCMTAALAVWPTGGAAANDGGRVVVQSIDVTAEQVTVHLSSASAYTQAALPRDPRHGRADRCYVDVAGVLGQQVERRYGGDARQVQQVRVAQFQPETVRVVLDLLSAQPCRVEQAMNPDRLVVMVGRSPRQDAMAGPVPAEPLPPAMQEEPGPEPPADQAVQQEPLAALQAAEALEYLDLRTPFASETRPAQALSIFDRQTPEGARSQLSLLGQPPEETASPSPLFSRQAIDDKTFQFAPRGLYLLQEQGQEQGQEAGSAAGPRLEW